MIRKNKKVPKKYNTFTKALQDKLQKEYLELWHQGYDSKTILIIIGEKNFKCYSRVCQLVDPRKLTKGIKRQNILIA